MSCNCLHGRAYEDAAGNCLCDDGTGTPKEGCDGVMIDGRCTGGIRVIPPLANEPLPVDTSAGGAFNMYGIKSPQSSKCKALFAPSGYHYIVDSSGKCVLAVDYDYDTTKFNATSGNGALGNLLGGGNGSFSDVIANNKGLISLGIAALVGYFAFGRDKDGTATSRTVISRRGIS
jgi:hypothetical protein